MSIIIFDTETFGTITSLENNINDLKSWPKIKQICWQKFDLNGNLIETNNFYFTTEQNNIKEVLEKFINDYENSKITVAHNFFI